MTHLFLSISPPLFCPINFPPTDVAVYSICKPLLSAFVQLSPPYTLLPAQLCSVQPPNWRDFVLSVLRKFAVNFVYVTYMCQLSLLPLFD